MCDTDACVPTGDVLIKGIMDEQILGLREEVSEGSVMSLEPPLMHACSHFMTGHVRM